MGLLKRVFCVGVDVYLCKVVVEMFDVFVWLILLWCILVVVVGINCGLCVFVILGFCWFFLWYCCWLECGSLCVLVCCLGLLFGF